VSKSKPNPVALRVLLGVVAAVVAIIILAAPRAFFHSRQPSVPVHFKVDREISTSVRIGSDKSQVMDYCTHRGWFCYDRGSTVIALDHAAEKTMIVRADVAITFQFNSAGKLLSFHSEDQYTGP
jgi:hypothetical protein